MFRMHNDRFRVVGSFEDNLYTVTSKDSYKFLTEARNIWMKTFVLTSRPVSGLMIGLSGFLSVSLLIQFRYLILRRPVWRLSHFLTRISGVEDTFLAL